MLLTVHRMVCVFFCEALPFNALDTLGRKVRLEFWPFDKLGADLYNVFSIRNTPGRGCFLFDHFSILQTIFLTLKPQEKDTLKEMKDEFSPAKPRTQHRIFDENIQETISLKAKHWVIPLS